MSQFEQLANMCRLGKSASETLSALQQVYVDTALKKSVVYDWSSRFKNGKETFDDDQRSGRPWTSRTEEMIGKVLQMSDDLKTRRVSAKFVLRQLNTDQMECRVMVAGDLFE
jgi:transposase